MKNNLNGGKAYTRNPLMEGFTENYFETKDGVKLRYLHKGEGVPLILLHGYGDDADCWFLNAPVFAEHYSVYCIEQRGHGYSKADHGARIARLSADLHEFIEALDVPKVNVLGWSMACPVIWSYIELFGQDKINKAVFDDQPPMLVANPQFTREEVMETGSNRMDVWYYTNTVRDYGTEWGPDKPFTKTFYACFHGGVDFAPEDYKKIPDNYLELIVKRPPMLDMENRRFAADLLKDLAMGDWRDLFPTIYIPTLLLTGDASMATTPECGAWMQAAMQNCTWIRFSKEEFCGHDLNQTAYKKFNKVVLEFLSE